MGKAPGNRKAMDEPLWQYNRPQKEEETHEPIDMRVSRKQLVLDYQIVFGSQAGKRVLNDLRNQCPLLLRKIVVTKDMDPYRIFLLEGRNDIVKHIYYMIHADPHEERATHAQGE